MAMRSDRMMGINTNAVTERVKMMARDNCCCSAFTWSTTGAMVLDSSVIPCFDTAPTQPHIQQWNTSPNCHTPSPTSVSKYWHLNSDIGIIEIPQLDNGVQCFHCCKKRRVTGQNTWITAFSDQQCTYGWRSGIVVSGVLRMNEVNARRAQLVPGWVTVFGRVYHLGM